MKDNNGVEFKEGNKIKTIVYMSNEDVGTELVLGTEGIIFAEPGDDEQLVGVNINGSLHYLPQDVLEVIESFEVATFDSEDDSKIDVVEGGLTYKAAEEMAKKLWESGEYFGVEVIDQDPNNMEPIVWIESKMNLTKKFYAIFDYDNKEYLKPILGGGKKGCYNTRSVKEVRTDILELLRPQIMEDVYERYLTMSVEEICLEQQWILEEHEEPFGEEEETEEHFNIFYVDVPPSRTGADGTFDEWIAIESFKTAKEALDFAKENFGTDSQGRVGLVTGIVTKDFSEVLAEFLLTSHTDIKIATPADKDHTTVLANAVAKFLKERNLS